MSVMKDFKKLGIETVTGAEFATGLSYQTLRNWRENRPRVYSLMLAGLDADGGYSIEKKDNDLSLVLKAIADTRGSSEDDVRFAAYDAFGVVANELRGLGYSCSFDVINDKNLRVSWISVKTKV